MVDLVVYLGNPGRQYKETRHNAAWLCIPFFSFASSLVWQRKFKGEYAELRTGSKKLLLHKPLQFMNRSGESIVAISSFYRIPAERILIVHDDVEMPFGEVGLKFGGGLAGHNGLRSAASALGTRDFYRIRIGVGRPVHGSVSSYVLGRFTEEELNAIEDAAAVVQEITENLAADASHPARLLERYRRYTV